jgi:hypothetical protein
MPYTYRFKVIEEDVLGRQLERQMSFEELFTLQKFSQAVEDTADSPLREAALKLDQTITTDVFANTLLDVVGDTDGSYIVSGLLVVSNTVAQDGVQFDFNGGDLVASIFEMRTISQGSNSIQSAGANALDGVLSYTSITGTNRVLVTGYLKVSAGGRLILRVASASQSSGVLTLHAGSWLDLHEIVER